MKNTKPGKLPREPLSLRMEGRGHRFRVRTRSYLVGNTFNLINLMTRYEVEGREHLFEAVKRAAAQGRGLITVSNHVSLFDDPMVLIAVLKLYNFNVQTKCWWSTACASNFNPKGKSLGARVARWFNEVSNMVFMARSYKGCKAVELPDSLAELLQGRVGWQRMELMEAKARQAGLDLESYLRSFVTAREGEQPTSLDQVGMLEACARINVGDWLHFFPEAGRSRNLSLRPARPGVGKVIYHTPEAEVVPLCFYGTQDVLPVGALVPRPFQKVVVSVGKPVSGTVLESLRREPATVETFSEISRFAMSAVAALRPGVLARYMGAQAAFDLLAEEAAEEALAAQATESRAPTPRPSAELPWPVVVDDTGRPDRRASV
ncbi:MAG: 1-acyl-sn-glycerol-3-phosphate acyltransferase [Deltaproteobacteria bacterium]|nr:1-acyl-sn-glycerol-3-phosphate acyltransferase [Deltaproteobacteria bacterium]